MFYNSTRSTKKKCFLVFFMLLCVYLRFYVLLVHVYLPISWYIFTLVISLKERGKHNLPLLCASFMMMMMWISVLP